MINFAVEHLDKKKILSIKGSMTIDHVNELKDILLEMKEHSDDVIVNIANVDALDASCLQLLCSAHQIYLHEKKSFELSSKCSEAFNQTVSNSGYAQHKGCKFDAGGSCLWLRWADK
jgi:anti-anti-sigma regulatory factor